MRLRVRYKDRIIKINGFYEEVQQALIVLKKHSIESWPPRQVFEFGLKLWRYRVELIST